MKKFAIFAVMTVLVLGLIGTSPVFSKNYSFDPDKSVGSVSNDAALPDTETGVINNDEADYGISISIGLDIWDLFISGDFDIDFYDDPYIDGPMLNGTGPEDPEVSDTTGDDFGWNTPDE